MTKLTPEAVRDIAERVLFKTSPDVEDLRADGEPDLPAPYSHADTRSEGER